tara:strand:+ start:1420 stop:1947 length:528 start_codon:yes stop_codon:yes gene_type:complete
MNNLIIYSSTDGHTKKICETIKDNSIHKNNISIFSIEGASQLRLEDYDEIIIGASIRYGKHNTKILEFIKKNKEILKIKKNAFFSVNVVARKSDKNTPETNPYIKKFLKKTSWQPMKLGVFAGKIDYPKLSFINKNIIRLIMFITKGPTDTNKIHEFTNWESVKKFIKEFDEMKN